VATGSEPRPRVAKVRQRLRMVEDSLETSVTPWVILTAVTFAATALWMIVTWLLTGDPEGR
jgi:hypothetical protein